MTQTTNRTRQPELVRANLLAAGAQLLFEGSPLSIGAVADAAGVTKGAVQHHFGTREELLMALCEEMMAEFWRATASGDPHASAAERYVRATFDMPKSEQEFRHSRAVLAASVAERAVAGKWAAWVNAERKREDGRSLDKLVARLAADGLWLSETLGIYDISKAERKALGTALQQLAQGSDRP